MQRCADQYRPRKQRKQYTDSDSRPTFDVGHFEAASRGEEYVPPKIKIVSPCFKLRVRKRMTVPKWAARLSHKEPKKIPLAYDALDFVIRSVYEHNTAIFPENVDIILQPETVGDWKPASKAAAKSKKSHTDYKSHEDHVHDTVMLSRAFHRVRVGRILNPIRKGGIPERRDPNNVKLGYPAIHSMKTRNGYSRNPLGQFYTS